MVISPPIRASNKFIKLLIENYEKELGRNFSFPRATERLLEDIHKMKVSELKRREKR